MAIFIGSRYETATVDNLLAADGTERLTVFRGDSPYNTDRFSLYLVGVGDRIDRLAYRFYGDESLWWVIADANDGLLSDPLTPGTLLRIPDGADIR